VVEDMPTKIDPLFRVLDAIGFVTVFLPWIIVFTLTYAFLEKTKVLGVEKGHARHKLNAVVAATLGLLVVGSSNVLGITTWLIQSMGLLAVVVLAGALLLGLFGVQHLPDTVWWNAVFFVVFMLVAMSVFYAMGWFGRGNGVVVVFVLFFVVLFIIKFWLKQTPQAPQDQLQHPATQGHPPSPRGAVGARPNQQARRAGPASSQRRPVVPTGLGELRDIPLSEEESFGDEETSV